MKQITIDDQRTEKRQPWMYAVFTDSFMSGWGHAPGRSLFALEVDSPEEARAVLANGKRRSDMKRGRLVKDVFKLRLHDGDHLSIRDRNECERWYDPYGFCDV